MTPFQLELSANAPWTSTTVGVPLPWAVSVISAISVPLHEVVHRGCGGQENWPGSSPSLLTYCNHDTAADPSDPGLTLAPPLVHEIGISRV